MERDDLVLLAQLLKTMKDLVEKLEISQKRKDMEEIERIKKEIIRIKNQIGDLL